VITRIHGKLLSVDESRAILAVESFEYEVLIADFARRQLQAQIGEPVSLHTVHYLEGNPAQGRVVPRLVGFLNVAEREFFEMFCSVDGVGVKKALRAMVRPVRDVASMIAEQDDKGLTTLPGIGAATSERIIAKLRRKMTKFALLAAGGEPREAEVQPNTIEDTYQVLLSLGHGESDARRLLDTALAEKNRYKDVDALLQAIYQQSNR